MNATQTVWKMVRKTFFPLWDRENKWKYRQVADADGCEGKCLWSCKTIKLTNGSRIELTQLFVHEICHAVTPGGHGRKWLRRMELAARKADTIGMKDLALRLRTEIKEYSQTPRVTRSEVYGRAQDIMVDCPNLSFGQLVHGLRREYGLSRRELLSGYPRLRSVYDKAVADADRYNRIRANFKTAQATSPEPQGTQDDEPQQT